MAASRRAVTEAGSPTAALAPAAVDVAKKL